MNQANNHKQISDAINILAALGMPRAQQNERSALCLLALLNLAPGKKWKASEKPLMGITPIMDWAREHGGKPCISSWMQESHSTIQINPTGL